MAEGGDSDDDKPYEATQKRLDDARRKGEVPHSTDLTTATAYGGVLLAALAFGATSLTDLGTALSSMLANADTLSRIWFSSPAATSIGPLFQAILKPLLGWFGLPMAAALLAVIAQRAFVVAPEKIQPKLDRISPIKGAQNKFGRNGLFEFAKSSVKLIIISTVLAVYLAAELPDMMMTMALEPRQIVLILLRMAVTFLAIVVGVLFLFGAVDALWQQAEHARKHRMSRKELTDETKESEGDPWMKSRRREKGIEIAMSQMMADVPKADVVIVNPTHFAVALRWDRGAGGAPVCVAKGVDAVALQIRRVAMEAGVPIRSDPPTARALWSIVEIGNEVPPEHYRAVAVAIRFADRIRARAKGGGDAG